MGGGMDYATAIPMGIGIIMAGTAINTLIKSRSKGNGKNRTVKDCELISENIKEDLSEIKTDVKETQKDIGFIKVSVAKISGRLSKKK
jgi:hypothetical protein